MNFKRIIVLLSLGTPLAFFQNCGTQFESQTGRDSSLDLNFDADLLNLASSETPEIETADELQENMASPQVIQISSYGAVGNGSTDDRAAFDAAINAVKLASKTKPARLELQPSKTYYLKRKLTGTTNEPIFDFTGVKNIIVDGQGSQLVLDRYDYVAEIRNSEGVHFKNLQIDYRIPNSTQGRISKVNSDGTFEIVIEEGYPLPVKSSSTAKFANSLSFNENRAYLNNINIYIIDFVSLGGRTYKAITEDFSKAQVAKLKVGYHMGFRAFAEGGKTNFHILSSKNVTFMNIDIFGTMKIAFTARFNEGHLVFDNVRIRRKPGTNRLVVGLSDSFHMKSNRARVLIQNSLIERTLDDGINLGSMAEVCHSYNPSTFTLELRDTNYIYSDMKNSAPLKVGDVLYGFNLSSVGAKLFLGGASVVAVTQVNEKVRLVRLNQGISGVECLASGTGIGLGGKHLEQLTATRFFSPQVSNPGFRVRNTVMREKTRNGILGKGFGGLIRGNRFENISGSGVDGTNNLMFNEGPFPHRMEISGNVFENIVLAPIQLGISTYSTTAKPTISSQSDVVNNEFIQTLPIVLKNMNHFNVATNIDAQGHSPLVFNVSGLTSSARTALFKLSNAAGVYFDGGNYYCQYTSMIHLKRNWGEKYQDYLSVRPAMPPGRNALRNCNDIEGIRRLASGGIYKINHDGVACQYGSMKQLRMLTGLVQAQSLPIESSLQAPLEGYCK